MKKRAVVICPGRGSYTKETLGYLEKYGAPVADFISDIDKRRTALNEPSISELDQAEIFKAQIHTKGEHASPLIYACAYTDFMAIDRDKFEIVAITGNSMGWYLALAYSGALNWAGSFELINTMGSMMKNEIIGGQVIYPICDERWVKSQDKIDLVDRVLGNINARTDHHVFYSIHLGGFVVLGGNKQGVAALLKELPTIENYPFQLINHAAFHTPLLEGTSYKAFETIEISHFGKPTIPLIDGRGAIWQPYSTNIEALYRYTLGHQVTKEYDFSKAVTVALKEFAPDNLILLGPGSTLGGSIGQILIEADWWGLKSKSDFMDCQAKDPILLAMGRPDQRSMAT